jgi:hypothetical protein
MISKRKKLTAATNVSCLYLNELVTGKDIKQKIKAQGICVTFS